MEHREVTSGLKVVTWTLQSSPASPIALLGVLETTQGVRDKWSPGATTRMLTMPVSQRGHLGPTVGHLGHMIGFLMAQGGYFEAEECNMGAQ